MVVRRIEQFVFLNSVASLKGIVEGHFLNEIYIFYLSNHPVIIK